MASISDRSSEENKENITLIWFDPNIREQPDAEHTINALRTINDYVLVYIDFEQCTSYIKSVVNEKVFLITSGMWAPIFLPLVIDLKQLETVFIFCARREQHLYLMGKFTKIAGVFSDQKELTSSIGNNIHVLNKQIKAFSFFDQKQKVSTNLSERTGDFLWLQLFHDVILNLPSNDKAKQQMINVCREYYRGNETELQQIDEFEKSYTSIECIRWYTKENFVYKMINKALRTEDIQQLYTFRFFIRDLSLALTEEYKLKNMEEKEHGIIMTVYRGIQLTLAELEEFRSNEGKLIAMNGYLSTSRSYNTAKTFAMSNRNRTQSLPVIFDIVCLWEENDATIFADISKLSAFSHEEEVLFDLGSVFKIEKVSKETDIWTICLRLTSEGQAITREYIEETKKEMKAESISILFGALLIRMGYYRKAQTYFQQLLKDPGNENLADIHTQLGLACQINADFHQAMDHFEIAMQLIRESSSSLLRNSSHILRYMSHVLIGQGQYVKALQSCNEALRVLEEFHDSSSIDVGHCLHGIGSCYLGQRKYNDALTSYEQALYIKRACLPEIHLYIAETLNGIGLVHFMTKDVEKALNFFLSSLEMYQACLPESHSDIADVLHNIADCYHRKNQLEKALQHYHLALNIKEKCFPPNHPSIATTLNNMSTSYSISGKSEKALALCLRALKMREQVLPFDHPDLAISFSSAGHKHEALKEYPHALENFEKALTIRAKLFSKEDPVRKRAERHVLRMKWKIS